MNDVHFVYEYQPTFGGSFFCASGNSPLQKFHGSNNLRIKLSLTDSGFLLILNDGVNSEALGYGYQGLESLAVEGGVLQLVLADTSVVRMFCTRPHFQACEIWANIAQICLLEWQRSSDPLEKEACLSILTHLKCISVNLPCDFLNTLCNYDSIVRLKCKFTVGCSPFLRYEYQENRDLNSILQDASVRDSSNDDCADSVGLIDVKMPKVHDITYTGFISSWIAFEGASVRKDEAVFSVDWAGDRIFVRSSVDGILESILCPKGSWVVSEQVVAKIRVSGSRDATSDSTLSSNHLEISSSSAARSVNITTAKAVANGSMAPVAGELPVFSASLASIPTGFTPTGSYEADLQFALHNPEISFQSFFNDLPLIVDSGLNDDVVSLPCFDEDMYSLLVKQMHRFTLAEVGDKKDSLAKENARLGTIVGALIGVFTSNPFAPFYGRNMGRIETEPGKRVEQFLPDPHLLFYQDEHSFLAWSRAQVVAPRIRRIIFSRKEKDNGSIYFRLLPALVTQSQRVLPLQIFKIDSHSYFYRPFAAGIERQQANYDSIKLLRRYSHFHPPAHSLPTDSKLTVSGRDVETYQEKLFRYQSDSLDYHYVDFLIPPGCVF